MNKYKDAVITFGRNHQFMIAMEELAETIQALSKYIRDPSPETARHVVEEYVDVNLTRAQVQEVLWKEQKITNKAWDETFDRKYIKMCDAIEEKKKQSADKIFSCPIVSYEELVEENIKLRKELEEKKNWIDPNTVILTGWTAEGIHTVAADGSLRAFTTEEAEEQMKENAKTVFSGTVSVESKSDSLDSRTAHGLSEYDKM